MPAAADHLAHGLARVTGGALLVASPGTEQVVETMHHGAGTRGLDHRGGHLIGEKGQRQRFLFQLQRGVPTTARHRRLRLRSLGPLERERTLGPLHLALVAVVVERGQQRLGQCRIHCGGVALGLGIGQGQLGVGLLQLEVGDVLGGLGLRLHQFGALVAQLRLSRAGIDAQDHVARLRLRTVGHEVAQHHRRAQRWRRVDGLGVEHAHFTAEHGGRRRHCQQQDQRQRSAALTPPNHARPSRRAG